MRVFQVLRGELIFNSGRVVGSAALYRSGSVLCGNAGVSYLSGLCVLGVYTFVLFLLNGLLIRKHA